MAAHDDRSYRPPGQSSSTEVGAVVSASQAADTREMPPMSASIRVESVMSSINIWNGYARVGVGAE